MNEMNATYSQPWPGLKMKKPFVRCAVIQATTITDNSPAAASGVSNPTSRSAPAPSSVTDASHACRMPGFIPILANHPAVPWILPPPKMWL